MFVELHILQNFAPSNLNRDDTGAPKDCEFGGHRRARISSQCIKRAIRQEFRREQLLPAEHLAHRTQRLVAQVAERLVKQGRDAAEAHAVAAVLPRAIGLGVDPDGTTQYLVYLGERELANLAEQCLIHWDKMVGLSPPTGDGGEAAGRGRGRPARQAAGKDVPGAVKDALLAALDGGKAADLALFGRMLADLPAKNVDAAAQVAHAISTNRVAAEFDFFTAVDDFNPADSTGAGMLGTVEFNSACFYRYANVDLSQLRENLNDDDLVRATVEAFVRAAVTAVPTGKQNSMAAQNPPSLVLAVVRRSGLWNLANAFVRPVSPGPDGDLIRESTGRLDAHWADLVEMYGQGGIVGTAVVAAKDAPLSSLVAARVPGLDALVERVEQLVAATSDGASAA